MLPEGKQAVWGVICFCRGWQLITNPDKHWGRGEGREREMWQTREREREWERERERDGAGQGDWHLNSTELPQSASDPVITTSVWVWTWAGQPRSLPPGPLTTNKPPSAQTHTEIGGRCENIATILDELNKSLCLQSNSFDLLPAARKFPASWRISAEGFTGCLYCQERHPSSGTLSAVKTSALTVFANCAINRTQSLC